MDNKFNIIEEITKAIKILNDVDDYFENLDNMLSNCDMLKSDHEHIIENEDIKSINLEKLFNDMKDNLNNRRKIKNDIQLRNFYRSSIGKLNSLENRQFLLQELNNKNNNLGKNYTCRLLTEEDLESFKKKKTSSLKRTKRKKEESENVSKE